MCLSNASPPGAACHRPASPATFIWFAENIGTFARAWAYPGQEHAWHPVTPMKFGAWYLLMYISFVLVAEVHRSRASEPLPKAAG